MRRPRSDRDKAFKKGTTPKDAAAVGLTKIRQGFHPENTLTPPQNIDHQPPHCPRNHDGQPAPELRVPPTSTTTPTSRASARYPNLLEHLHEHEPSADQQSRPRMEPPVTSLTKADPTPGDSSTGKGGGPRPRPAHPRAGGGWPQRVRATPPSQWPPPRHP